MDDALVLQLEDRIESIARENLETSALMQRYGALDAAERLADSHGKRTYAWIQWQVTPLFSCAVGLGLLTAFWSSSLIIGAVWMIIMGCAQWTAFELAYESTYRTEDAILFKNIDQGLLNLRRIEALDLKELDKISLSHRATQIQSLINTALVARRTDLTVSERIIQRLIGALFNYDYQAY